VVRRLKVRLVYGKRAGEQTERLVDPLGLVDKDDVWYLIAGTESGQRTFRADRVVEAVVTDVPAVRPADFELSEAWGRVVDEMEQRRSLLSATILVEPRYLFVFHDTFGRHCEVEGSAADGRARVRVAAPTALMIAQHLAGWGALVEVLEPVSVRDELARIGSELSERYPA
jgi:predicted DNA-binding transcriptional regulator YafY